MPTETTRPSTKYTTNRASTLSQQPSKPTEPPRPTPTQNPHGLHCLFVADLYNFGNKKEGYEWEVILMDDIGIDFFEKSPISRIGLWAYGFTDYPKSPDLNESSGNYDDFSKKLDGVRYQHTGDPLNTSR
ncbi:hypothetical protein ANCCAN_27839 [Ancylostoma caninum]|uniref:Uncharacterized protein n=1 Tax=Ancylostoma caninum TaxID=29170 RepID=A0A368F2W1_ANCCA|nr:hypothetical protein ANCCAN_27839 [Ancylostoma caninum]